MKMKLSEVINMNQTLKHIIDNEKGIEPLFKFKLLGIMKSFENHIANFEVIKNEKIMEYGKETEDGNIGISQDDKDAIQKFNEELLPIINSDVDINISKLKASEVFNMGLSADYLMGLYPIIKE
ncbi:MAG: hypothetical protein J6D02_00675 [Lachnospira sp.]|nr:hypothetical protein [Lachnospira sp.]